MKKNLSYILLMFIFIFYSCTEDTIEQTDNFLSGSGVFILNEGNFMAGNGSLSYYSYDSLKIYNDLFESVNSRPLGDVPNSLIISGEKLIVVVNNSGKIEVLNKNTLESLNTITGLNAPRQIGMINMSKAYVTSIYSDSLTILDLSENSISGYINIRRSSEAIAVIRNKAYVANWVGGNEIMVINTDNNTVIDSITVAMEPESMVIDSDKKLWVLCNGGWRREYNAELISINTSTDEIEKRLVFPDINSSPSSLQIDGTGSTLYYLCPGIFKLKTDAASVPSQAFIDGDGSFFYKLGVNPVNGDILATDAVDYQQKGHILIYDNEGALKSDVTAGIIPAMTAFSLKPGFTK